MDLGKLTLVRLTLTCLSTIMMAGGLGIDFDQRAQALAQAPQAEVDKIDEALKDVSTKYRLREIYTNKEGETVGGEINQTRNAFRETLTMTVDAPKGAPLKSERMRQLIYSERPAAISTSNRVDAVVRRFETLRFEPAPQGLNVAKNPPLDGLVIWAMRGQSGEQIMSLQEGRSITDFEYQVATTVPTLLNFSELLPQTPVRVGDTWPLNRVAARVLVGRGQVKAISLNGSLKKVKPQENAPEQIEALIEITGQVATDLGTSTLNLQYLFTFSKKAAAQENIPAIGGKVGGKMLSTEGGIKKLSMAQVELSDVPGSDGRLKQVFERKLVYERQFSGKQTPLAIPATAPTPTKANSWLVFEDPSNRFKIKHPPVFKPQMDEENSILFATASEIPDFIRIDLDGSGVKPEGFRKELEAEWKAEGTQIFALTEGFLNDKAWANRRVYRIEAALKVADSSATQRGHFDAYVMQFPQGNQTYIAESTTWQERSDEFRNMVEEVLQTIELSTPAASAAPAATKPPAGSAPNPPTSPKPLASPATPAGLEPPKP
ncbi:MAG: hypothetical protein WCJ40_01285 [Planctomycetota bacterium]|nr:hypothetical protein [Planctomycetota bacterium]